MDTQKVVQARRNASRIAVFWIHTTWASRSAAVAFWVSPDANFCGPRVVALKYCFNAMAAPGDTLGRYRLLRLLARGRMGDVFLGERQGAFAFAPQVAIRVFHPWLASDADFSAKVVEAAKAASTLNHQNLVSVLDFGVESGATFVVMECVLGVTLSSLLRALIADARGLSLATAMYIAQELARALSYVHTRIDAHGAALHLVHGRVVSNSVLISMQGEVKLAGFSFARAHARMRELAKSADQAQGNTLFVDDFTSLPIDASRDLFFAGLVFWELFTGRHPLLGLGVADAADVMHGRKLQRPSAVAGATIPNQIDELVMRLLEPNATERWTTAEQVLSAIYEFQQQHSDFGMLVRQGPQNLALLIGDLDPEETQFPKPSEPPRERRIEAAQTLAYSSHDAEIRREVHVHLVDSSEMTQGSLSVSSTNESMLRELDLPPDANTSENIESEETRESLPGEDLLFVPISRDGSQVTRAILNAATVAVPAPDWAELERRDHDGAHDRVSHLSSLDLLTSNAATASSEPALPTRILEEPIAHAMPLRSATPIGNADTILGISFEGEEELPKGAEARDFAPSGAQVEAPPVSSSEHGIEIPRRLIREAKHQATEAPHSAGPSPMGAQPAVKGPIVGAMTARWIRGEVGASQLAWDDEAAARRAVATRNASLSVAHPYLDAYPAPSPMTPPTPPMDPLELALRSAGPPRPSGGAIAAITQNVMRKLDWSVPVATALTVLAAAAVLVMVFFTRVAWPDVRFETQPPGASIRVDGQVVPGTTPLNVRVRPNVPHHVEVMRAGFARRRLDAPIEIGYLKTRTYAVTLARLERSLAISPVAATVLVNEREVGVGDRVVLLGDTLGEGALKIEVRADGYVPWAQTFMNAEEMPASLDVVLTKR